MVAAKTKKTNKQRTTSKSRTEPPWNVILHNDRTRMGKVVYLLKKFIPGMSIGKAVKAMHHSTLDWSKERLVPWEFREKRWRA